MRITQQMVADGAGVSIATVSRALAGHPAIPIETRRRVEQVARRLGYQASGRQSSRARNVATIGILAASDAAAILPAVLSGISAAAGAAGIGTAVHVLTDGNPDNQSQQIAQWAPLAAGNLAGVIAVGCWPPAVLQDMLGALPLVVIGNAAATEVIAGDPVTAVSVLHARLRELGHRQLAFCHDADGALDAELATAAFKHAESTLGTVSPTVLAVADHQQIRKLTMTQVTAWICNSSATADRLATILDEAKLGIPRDVSVAAIGAQLPDLSNRWSTVAYDWQATGNLALARLQAAIAAGPLLPTVSRITGTVGPEHTIGPPPGAR